MATEVKSTYNSTELELYAIADLACNNLTTDLAAFAAKKAKYTAAFVTALRGVRTAALNLPDEEARNAGHQILKNKLVKVFLPPVLQNFNDLKGYIKDAFPTEDPEPRYEAAGGTHYAKAAGKDWEEVVGLNADMQTFIAANNAILTTPGGMPAAFVTKVNTDTTNFHDNYLLFVTARETGVGRAAKVTANNLLHKQLMDVLEDGAERVFRSNEAKQKNYFFEVLKAIVSPPGSASLKVTVMTGGDVVVPNVPVMIKTAEAAANTVNTDDDGVAFFGGANPGSYAGTVTVNSVVTNFTKDVDTGVDARVTVVV